MADIELVIKMPKDVIEGAKSSPNYYPTYHFEKIWRAIVNGTPLPKGHGRLIDADKLEYTCNSDECGMLTGCNHCQYHIITEDEVDNALTIIEADKESEEV